MSKIWVFIKRHSITIVLLIVLIAAGAVAKTAIMRKNQELQAVKAELGHANHRITGMANEIGTLKMDASLATKEATELKAKVGTLTQDIAAFAKQAAACEAVKKKLKIKN